MRPPAPLRQENVRDSRHPSLDRSSRIAGQNSSYAPRSFICTKLEAIRMGELALSIGFRFDNQ